MRFFWHPKLTFLPSKCTELHALQEYVTIVTVSFINRNLQSTNKCTGKTQRGKNDTVTIVTYSCSAFNSVHFDGKNVNFGCQKNSFLSKIRSPN